MSQNRQQPPPTLIVKRGLPGTGKSTAARKQVRENPFLGRINRDDLREMLFNSKWTPRREQIIVDTEKAIAGVLKKHGYSAIIDDTNLTEGHVEMWKQSALGHGFKHFEVEAFTGNLELAVKGDAGQRGTRERSVGKAIIHRLALMNGLIDFGPKPIIIVDIDGTIADCGRRLKYVQQKPKDWKRFADLCHFDQGVEFVIKIVRALHPEHTIVLCSGREDKQQQKTLRWLDVWNVPYDYIFMRPTGDSRDDVIVKKDFLDKMPKDQILAVFDDRPSVVRMWRENGVRVIPVRGACEEF